MTASPAKAVVQGPISILNVGARILLRDTMDQYLRSLGDIRTHYASNMKAALRFFEDHMVHILITEVELEDGTAQRLLNGLGWKPIADDLYVILAIEEKRDDLLNLAMELEVNSVLVKPFAAADLKAHIEKFKIKQNQPLDPAITLMKEAYVHIQEKFYSEADKKFRKAMAGTQLAQVFYRAGLFYMSRPDYKSAEQCLNKAIDLKPHHAAALSALGQLSLVRGDLEAGIQYLRRAHQISPLNPERALLMSKYHIQSAAEVTATILNIDESHPLARLELGKLLVLQKDYIGGLGQLERAQQDLKGDSLIECQTYMAVARKLGHILKS